MVAFFAPEVGSRHKGFREELTREGFPTGEKKAWALEARRSVRYFPGGLQDLQLVASAEDKKWMSEALALAREAEKTGEVPVGAVVVRDGEIIGRGANRSLADHDPTGHAEMLALRQAGHALKNYRLEGCELFVTIEPCAMCAGALVHARVGRLIYGADDPKAGAVHSALQVVNHPQLNHKMQVTGGVLGQECSELLQSFFRARRNKNP